MNILERFSLKGKVIVVTGGTGILGKAFVKALAEAGAKICIIGRSQEKADERVKMVQTLGGEALAIVADVMDENSVRIAKEQILNKWNTIDGLVNAAGGNIPGATIGPDDNLFDNKISDTIKAIELNLYGTIIPTGKRFYYQYFVLGCKFTYYTCFRLYGSKARHRRLNQMDGNRTGVAVWR